LLDRPVTEIGRSDDNRIVLDDSQISRHHARIELAGEQLYITDLGSSNGTSVNGIAIKSESRHELKAGDVITMGNASLTIRHSSPVSEAPVATPVAAPQPPFVPETPASQAAPVKKRSWIKWFVLGIAIVVVAIGALMVAGALSSPSEQGKDDVHTSMQAYSNSERQFYFTYPPDWEEMPSSVIGQDESIITGFWASSEEYGVTSNVLIATEDLPGGMDIDSYFDLSRQSFEDGPPITISQEDITVADIPAIKWVYQSPSVKSVTQMQVSFIRDNTAWLLIFTCADKAFDSSEAIFDDMIESFRFTDNRSNVIFSTAKLSEATMTTAVDADMRPLNATDVFTVNTPEIHCSVKLSNAPDDTEIKSEWVYLHGEREDLRNYMIDSTIVITEGTRYLDFSLSNPENGWPIGEYELILSIDEKEAMRVPFSVKKLDIVKLIPHTFHSWLL
jgi:pSer/pThr/pTyr-binding forkhead associated (FHA) protein